MHGAPVLFVALRPPEAIRDPLIDTMEGVEGARWQADEQLHLTLRFVGEVDRAQANDLASALEAVRAPRFALDLRSVGTFERKGRVGSLWAGVEESEPLNILQRRVERACRAAGLEPVTRKFVPQLLSSLADLKGFNNIGYELAYNYRSVEAFTFKKSQPFIGSVFWKQNRVNW